MDLSRKRDAILGAGEVALRLCRQEDLLALEWSGAFSHHREIIGEAFALQAAGEAWMLVAEHRGVPIGQAWLDLRPQGGALGPMVWAVRVIAAYQGRGVGTRLIRRLEDMAADAGHAWLELGVEMDNPAARAFYERLGWRVAGERRDTYSYVTPEGRAVVHHLSEWRMVRRLARGR